MSGTINQATSHFKTHWTHSTCDIAHHEDELEGEVCGEQRHMLHVLVAAGPQAAARRSPGRADVAAGACTGACKTSHSPEKCKIQNKAWGG